MTNFYKINISFKVTEKDKYYFMLRSSIEALLAEYDIDYEIEVANVLEVRKDYYKAKE